MPILLVRPLGLIAITGHQNKDANPCHNPLSHTSQWFSRPPAHTHLRRTNPTQETLDSPPIYLHGQTVSQQVSLNRILDLLMKQLVAGGLATGKLKRDAGHSVNPTIRDLMSWKS